MKKSQIIPTVLVKSKSAYINKIKLYEQSFNLAQIDVLNDSYIKGKSYHCSKTTNKLKTKLKFEVHLMINNPLRFIKRWKTIDKIKRFIVHVETVTVDDFELIKKELKGIGINLALAISPGTKLSLLKSFEGKFSYLLVMGVIPGRNGAPFLVTTYSRIKKIKKMFPKVLIGVDGGVSDKNSSKLIDSGASRLNTGSFLAGFEDMNEAVSKLVKTIGK